MLLEITHTNLEQVSQIINTIDTETPHDFRMVLYLDRSNKPIIKVLICTENEWLAFYQFCISSEYMKGNIDVVSNAHISQSIKKLIISTLNVREEYTNETAKIITTVISSSSDGL